MGTRLITGLFLVVLLAGCVSKSKEELFASGMGELKKGNPNGAAVFFKSALDKDSNYFEARYQLAKAYLLAGKLELSAKEYATLIKGDASRKSARLELARIDIVRGKAEQASTDIDAYVRQYGASAETYELMGLASAAADKLEKAEEYFRKALALEPSRHTVRLELALLYLNKSFKGKEPESRRLINEVIAAEPTNVKSYQLLAMMEANAGNIEKAIAAYKKIYEIDSNNSQALYRSGLLSVVKGDREQGRQTADLLVSRFPKRSEGVRLKGVVNYHEKKFTDAIIDLQKSISMQPSLDAYYYLGLCHYNLGELEQALGNFKRVGEKSAYGLPAKTLYAMTLLRQKRYNESLSEAKQMLTANPGSALAHNIMGSALIGLGQYDEGMAEFNKAIELDKKIIDAHLNKGAIHLFKGKMREAENDFVTALQVSPELLNTRLILASLYAREKNHAKAIDLLQKGLSGNKSDAVIYNYMAAVMFSRGMNDEGFKYLQQSQKTDPAYLTSSFNIAIYYSATGQYDKALEEYAGILVKSPQNSKAMISTAALHELKKNDKEALNYYNRALKTKEPSAYLAVAYYYLRKGETKKAISALNDGIANVARNMDAMEMKRQILTAEAKFDEAIKVCDDMEATNPQFGAHKKIQTYLAKKDVAKAREYAQRQITVNPSSAYGYIDLANVFEYSGDPDRAITEIRNGMKVDRHNLDLQQKLGDLFAKKKDYAKAEGIYKDILLKNPGYIPALFNHGRLLEETGKKAEAMNKYREVLVKSENFVPALNNLAYLNVESFGNLKEGLRLAFLSARLNPTSPEVMDTLGYALLRNGRTNESQQVLEKAYKLLPGNPTVAYHLALAYMESGSQQKGKELLQKSLSLGDFPEAGAAAKLLTVPGSR